MRFSKFVDAAVFALILCAATSILAQQEECNCSATECPTSATALLGTPKEILSPGCEEGSVASLEVMRTIADTGDYEVITWNPGASTWTDTFTSTYKYAAATTEQDVMCFDVPPENLPVIGDQKQLKVTLNCERTTCNFRYDIKFWCYQTGVLVDDAGGGLQVLSDVDDTIVCPNPQGSTDPHSFAGVDTRLEAKEIYPGVAELMLGMALGPGLSSTNATTNTTETANSSSSLLDGAYVPARPMLLSARPREVFAVLAISQDSELNLYMEEVGHRNNHPSWGINIDASRYGTLLDGSSFQEFGETKAKHYVDVSSLLNNTRFAFFGDNGQGDVCGAQSMLQSSTGDRLIAVFIHTTQTQEESITECEDPDTGAFTLDLPESETVHYHNTHANAALWAYDQNLISCCSANNVYVAINEWVTCRCDGNCTYELPTGISEPATRNETLAYCDEVKADQATLKETLDQCDAQGDCPLPEELPPRGTSRTSGAASGTTSVFVVTLLGVALTVVGFV